VPSRVTSPVSGSKPNPLKRTKRSLGTIAGREAQILQRVRQYRFSTGSVY
jgi:hypothetical protein